MDRKELIRRYNLATSSEWEQIRELFVNKIIELSKGSKPELLQGMLMLLNEPKYWVSDYEKELRKAHEEGK